MYGARCCYKKSVFNQGPCQLHILGNRTENHGKSSTCGKLILFFDRKTPAIFQFRSLKANIIN